MKREGRQHGFVRTYMILPSPLNPKPKSRFINSFDSPPTAGFFTKVHPKPTNHSKFTAKCGKQRCNECHMQPCCKSKEKTKGTKKNRSLNCGSNYKSITWRVVDSRPRLNFAGFSASGILNQLAVNDDYVDDDDVYDNDEIDGDYDDNYLGNSNSISLSRAEMDNGNGYENEEIIAAADDNRLIEEDEEDEGDEEDWYLVEEKFD